MSAEIMWRQTNPNLLRRPRDERSGPGVAEPEDPVLRLPPLLGQIPVEPLRDPSRQEGDFWMPTLWRRKAELAPLNRASGEPQDLPDSQAAPGLQLDEEPRAEVRVPVD